MDHAERRQQRMADRRQQDVGPPRGMADRRRLAERRCPTVSQVPFDEWAEAASNHYYHLKPTTLDRRRMEDRRIADCGPPPGGLDRRVLIERRRPDVADIQIGAWADAMSNYYYHFHR